MWMISAWMSNPPPITKPMGVLVVAGALEMPTAVVTVSFRPLSEVNANPASINGATTLDGKRYLANSGNSNPWAVTVSVEPAALPPSLRGGESAANSTPRPKGKRASKVTPAMYRLVLELKPKFLLSTVEKKSVRGTPAFTPKLTGWAMAEAAPSNIRNRDFMVSPTSEVAMWFPL